MENLNCNYDSKKSFYGKAKINQEGNVVELFSYNTKVAVIENNKPKILIEGVSQTTLRHIKEFLKQKGYFVDNKNQIMRDYK